jgi:hypothetical protein
MSGALAGVTGLTGLSVGGGGSYLTAIPIHAISATSVTVVATTCTATKSVTTTSTWSGVTVGDALFATPLGSGLSAGVVMDAYVNAANTVTIRYSNVSTANASQIATPILLVAAKIVAV